MDSRKVEQNVSDAVVQKPIDLILDYEKSEIILERKFSFNFLLGFIPYVTTRLVPKEKITKIHEKYQIFPPTLGKLQILAKLFLKLELDFEAIKEDPATELFKCCENKSAILAEIMAVSVLRKKEDLLNPDLIASKRDLFLWNTTPEDFSIIVGAILMQIDLTNFSNSIRLTKLFRLNEPKDNKHGANRVEK